MQLITFLIGMGAGVLFGFLLAALLFAGNAEEWENQEELKKEKR